MAFMSREQFNAVFNAAIAELAAAEKVTKAVLSSMSRDLLLALHAPEADGSPRGDVTFINQLLAVLTPVNKRAAIAFFKEFSGFHFDARNPKTGEGTDLFTKKDRKAYAEAEKRAADRLEDPHFNIWTWADQHLKIEKKYDIKSLTKAVEKALDQTDGDQVAVLKAVFAAGITTKAVEILLMQMAEEVAAVEDEEKA